MSAPALKDATAATLAQLEIVPASPIVGAEVRGVDLSKPLDDATFAAIHRAWIDNCVILLRDQKMTDADQVAFSRRLGSLDEAPNMEAGQTFASGFREIYVISNVIENGKAIGSLGSGEAVWHTDMSYLDNPPKASSLYALEIPSAGGDTWFLNMYMAYEEMPADMKRRIESLRIKHDGTHNSGGYLRAGMTQVDDPSQSAGTYHPAVITHPESGRKALYLGRRPYAYVEGMSVAESEKLLDELWEWVEQPRFAWAHNWRVGDFVLWDNRCVMHRRDSFDAGERRVLHRTQIQGERPVA